MWPAEVHVMYPFPFSVESCTQLLFYIFKFVLSPKFFFFINIQHDHDILIQRATVKRIDKKGKKINIYASLFNK